MRTLTLNRFLLAPYACATSLAWGAAAVAAPGATPPANPTSIRHVVVIMQENRSFDSNFGTYPGADGIPRGTCVPIDPDHAGQPLVTAVPRCAGC